MQGSQKCTHLRTYTSNRSHVGPADGLGGGDGVGGATTWTAINTQHLYGHLHNSATHVE